MAVKLPVVVDKYPEKRKTLSGRILDIVENRSRELLGIVVARVRSGRNVRGRAFPPYSKRHASYREARNRQTASVDFTLRDDTPSMLDDVGIIDRRVEGEKLIVEMGALNRSSGEKSTDDKLVFASNRNGSQGNILAVQKKELNPILRKINKDIAEEVKKIFRNNG